MQKSLFFVFFLLPLYAFAQVTAEIYVDGNPFESKTFKDTVALTTHIRKLNIDWLAKGHYFAGTDSVKRYDRDIKVWLHKGKKLQSELDTKGKDILKTIEDQLRNYANNGYPFSSIKLDSLQIEEGSLRGTLDIRKGPYITYDSAFFFASLKTHHSYLYQLFEIVPGKPYSESGYRFVAEKADRSPFLSLNRPVDISFQKEKATVYLDLSEETSGSFQGVLGLQPGQAGQPTTVIGSLRLDIQNLFRTGKKFNLLWERFAENSQQVRLSYVHPFLFSSGISPAARFELFKQDSTFLTRITGIGIQTFISSKTVASFDFIRQTGSLLTTHEPSLSKQGLADYENNFFSIKLSKGHFEKLSTLKEGIAWEATLKGGRKQILKNVNLADSFYDTITFKTNSYQVDLKIAYQLKIGKKQTFFHEFSVGHLQNKELLANERYRLGGLNSLRGFNEKLLFADRYLLSRVELRSFFENRSYLYVFSDQLIYRNRNFSDVPVGAGLGFSLLTSSGQFNFALAVGRSKDQQLEIAGLKAHFGYISRF